MKDDAMYKILEDFANNHTLAENIKVRVSRGHVSYESLLAYGAKYDDAVLLSRLVDGAIAFMFWLRREGKARLVKLSQKTTRKCDKSSSAAIDNKVVKGYCPRKGVKKHKKQPKVC